MEATAPDLIRRFWWRDGGESDFDVTSVFNLGASEPVSGFSFQASDLEEVWLVLIVNRGLNPPSVDSSQSQVGGQGFRVDSEFLRASCEGTLLYRFL
jgi:hypothetical protein